MLMGLCITVTCIVELPIFAANNWILKTLGVNSVIHITLAVCVIRMVSQHCATQLVAFEHMQSLQCNLMSSLPSMITMHE